MRESMELLHADMRHNLKDLKVAVIRWIVFFAILQTMLLVGILARLAKVI